MIIQLDNVNSIRCNKPEVSTSIELSNLLFLDLETTGLRPDRGASITEVSILNRNSQLYYWQTEAGTKFDKIVKELLKILTQLKQGVVVGHNLQFDFWFIAHECDRIGLDGPNIQFIDTISLSQKLLRKKNSYKLGELLKHFEIKVNGKLHTATTDTEATRALFWKLIEKGGISTVGEAGMKKLNWSSF